MVGFSLFRIVAQDVDIWQQYDYKNSESYTIIRYSVRHHANENELEVQVIKRR